MMKFLKLQEELEDINNGFFGTTGNLKIIKSESISFIENHEFSEIQKIYWRNSSLSFSSKNHYLTRINKNKQELLYSKKECK